MRAAPALLAPVALAVAVAVATPARADGAGHLRHFADVCLKNAPAFEDAAIRAGAERQVYKASDASASASAQWRPGKSCAVAMRLGSTIAPAPTVEQVEPLVVETFNRLGSGKYTMKKVTKNGVRYRIDTPAGRFEIGFSRDGANHRYSISKL